MKSSLDSAPGISTLLAIYGAVLATITAIIQLLTHWKDKPHIRIQLRHNMMTDIPRYRGMTLTIVTAVNDGRRPVTIEGFAAALLDSREQWVLGDVQPPTPHQIKDNLSARL